MGVVENPHRETATERRHQTLRRKQMINQTENHRRVRRILDPQIIPERDHQRRIISVPSVTSRKLRHQDTLRRIVATNGATEGRSPDQTLLLRMRLFLAPRPANMDTHLGNLKMTRGRSKRDLVDLPGIGTKTAN